MIRVKRGNVRIKTRKKFLKLAKGYRGSNSRLHTYAMEQVVQSLNFAYKGRKLKKQNFRELWILRLSAAARARTGNYSTFIGLIRKKNILLNRKMLSLLILKDFSAFNFISRKAACV